MPTVSTSSVRYAMEVIIQEGACLGHFRFPYCRFQLSLGVSNSNHARKGYLMSSLLLARKSTLHMYTDQTDFIAVSTSPMSCSKP